MLYGLSLFSGIGGIDLALSEWVTPILYCERERFAQALLLSLMSENKIAAAPIWNDVSTLRWPEGAPLDILYGGFPCQDLSFAGDGAGLAGERSGLYFELERLIREAKPTFVFLENVPAIRTRGLGRVVWGLSELGYDSRWTIVSAAEVGAPHMRKRWFLLAHAKGERQSETRKFRRIKSKKRFAGRSSKTMADSEGERGNSRRFTGRGSAYFPEPQFDSSATLGHAGRTGPQGPEFTEAAWKALSEHRYSGQREWPSGLPKPAIHRGDDGLLNRVDRTRGLGNAVVPLQAKVAFEKLMGFK